MNTNPTIGRLDGRSCQRQDHARMAMPKNTMLSIVQPLGLRIECIEGCLWITQDGDPHDTVLSPGEHHVAERCPRLIVQALEAGVVRIASRHPAASAL